MNVTVERSCECKLRYEDAAAARAAVKAFTRRHKDAKSTLHPYFCRFCHGWHNGNRRKK